MHNGAGAYQGFMAQTWFKAQAAFDDPSKSDWWLKDPVTGVAIDCNSSSEFGSKNICMGYSQGAPGRLYDWRIKAVRDYFTNEVIAPYVDCPNISGIFMDVRLTPQQNENKNAMGTAPKQNRARPAILFRRV
jgi:hypothetical protein